MSRLAIITFITPQGVDIDNGLPSAPVYPGNALPGGPVDPGYGRPGGGWSPVDPGFGGGRPVRPDNGLPVGPPGSIGTLPVFPFDPTAPGIDNTLPGSGGGQIDNTLPGGVIHPGMKFVVKWLACQGLILVPDNTLPTTPPPTSGTLPGTTPEPK